MMTRGKRSSTATASSAQVKRPRAMASSTSRPTKSKRPKQTSRVHSVPALNPPEVPHPSELSREPAISGPSSVSSPAASSSVVSQNMVSSITSAISSAVLESLKSAGIIPQEPVQTSDPAAAVQGSVAQVVQDLTGEGHTLTSTSITSGPETDHRPDKIHTLISVPLSSRVPDKIQSKIWANEYIDLGTLLSSLPGDPKYNFTVKSSGSNQPVVSLEPVQNSKRITSIDQWTTAFQVFVAVYTIRFPDSAPGLMKYSATVRDLAAKNAHWRYYDENFRYLRQKSLFPWDEVHWELWLQAHHMTKLSSSNNPPNSFNRQSKQPFPRGFCWKFHQGERCFGCNFKHACFKCGGDHPATKCKSGKPTVATSRTVASSPTTNTSQSK